MREVVLDTETTGLDPRTGDRVVEVGAIELVGHVATGRRFHAYLNPGRPMPEEAFKVHGLSDAFLADKPTFDAVAGELLDFLGDAPLIAHNAGFDMAFLSAELVRAGRPALDAARAVDTRALAKRRFPGAPASLDALCRRFGIDTSARTLHGALLDSEILAEVYLELIGGRQPGFGLDPGPGGAGGQRAAADAADPAWRPRPRTQPLPPRITEAERAAHAGMVEAMGPGAIWRRLGAS